MAVSTDNTTPPRVKDIRGLRFGALTVVSYFGPRMKKGHLWLCQCDCGNTSVHETRQMTSGKTKSCGCLRRKLTSERFNRGRLHLSHRLEYNSYRNMITRCYNPNHKDYRFYGAAGRSVCARWRFGEGERTGFECFVDDMPRRLSAALTLDRIDNNGDYEPANCRWATKAEQTANR